MSFGGPQAMPEVMPFLRHVVAGRDVPEERLAAVAEQYRAFGGVSPLNSHNRDLVERLKERGLGWALMSLMLDYARAEGLRFVEGQVLRENTAMLKMCAELGFTIATDPDDPNIRIAGIALQP